MTVVYIHTRYILVYEVHTLARKLFRAQTNRAKGDDLSIKQLRCSALSPNFQRREDLSKGTVESIILS